MKSCNTITTRIKIQTWNVKSYGLALLLIVFLCTCGRAQDSLRLIARPHGDSIIFRWAPTTFAAWRQLRENGVLLERRELGGPATFRAVHGDRLRAFSVAEFRALTDTDDPHIVAVAEALHGEAISDAAPSGPLGKAKEMKDEQDQRLFLALLNADLSTAAAHALGWRWTDKTIERGRVYEYRVRALPAEGQVGPTLQSAPLRVRGSDKFPFGEVFDLSHQESERKVTLRWAKSPNQEMFFAYYIEVSDDGENFRRVNEIPLVKDVPEAYFEHPVEVEENYRPRYYRLRGMNAFAEVGPPSEVIRAQGVDRTGPAAPSQVRATDLRDGTFQVTWTSRGEQAPDLAGYVVMRGTSLYGKLTPAHTGLLPREATEWIDPTPIPYRSNYYAVLAVDTAGNSLRSAVTFAMWYDDTPPAAPIGLTGRIDTMGNVFLMWEPGKEPDLHGYRVYVSHAKKREFFQVTEEILHQNYYFDSTRLNVLNEDVYYEIVALDNNYNPSERSAILTLRRPDKVAPAAPVINDFSARGSSVVLRWRPSVSPDVVRQEIWREGPDETAHPLRALTPTDSIFADTTTRSRNNYTYFVRALDEVNLFADSRPLSLRSGSVTQREGVDNLARTQVQGSDQETLRWTALSDGISGFQLYGGPAGNALRPLRRIPGVATEWPLPNTEHHYALQVIYADGSRSGLSEILEPGKE